MAFLPQCCPQPEVREPSALLTPTWTSPALPMVRGSDSKAGRVGHEQQGSCRVRR